MKNYNTEIIQAAKALFINKGDGFEEVSDVLQPVMPIVYPGQFFTTSYWRGTTGSLTAFTARSDQDTYITGITVVMAKDATCDTADGNIRIVITCGGATLILCYIPIITLTAALYQFSIPFPNPLKMDRGTSLTFEGTFTAGKLQRCVTVTGYRTEPSGAN